MKQSVRALFTLFFLLSSSLCQAKHLFFGDRVYDCTQSQLSLPDTITNDNLFDIIVTAYQQNIFSPGMMVSMLNLFYPHSQQADSSIDLTTLPDNHNSYKDVVCIQNDKSFQITQNIPVLPMATKNLETNIKALCKHVHKNMNTDRFLAHLEHVVFPTPKKVFAYTTPILRYLILDQKTSTLIKSDKTKLNPYHNLQEDCIDFNGYRYQTNAKFLCTKSKNTLPEPDINTNITIPEYVKKVRNTLKQLHEINIETNNADYEMPQNWSNTNVFIENNAQSLKNLGTEGNIQNTPYDYFHFMTVHELQDKNNQKRLFFRALPLIHNLDTLISLCKKNNDKKNTVAQITQIMIEAADPCDIKFNRRINNLDSTLSLSLAGTSTSSMAVYSINKIKKNQINNLIRHYYECNRSIKDTNELDKQESYYRAISKFKPWVHLNAPKYYDTYANQPLFCYSVSLSFVEFEKQLNLNCKINTLLKEWKDNIFFQNIIHQEYPQTIEKSLQKINSCIKEFEDLGQENELNIKSNSLKKFLLNSPLPVTLEKLKQGIDYDENGDLLCAGNWYSDLESIKTKAIFLDPLADIGLFTKEKIAQPNQATFFAWGSQS